MTKPSAKFPSEEGLAARMRELGIREADLVEKFVHGGGAGGQKINKTASTVYLKHLATGLEVKCQDTRSQAQNRLIARERLFRQIFEQKQAAVKAAQFLKEKKRRQNRRRTKSQKETILRNKHRRSEVKSWRKKVRPEGF